MLASLAGFHRSTNNGASWRGGGNFITGNFALLGTNIFAASRGGVFRSTDSGATWISTTPQPTGGGPVVVHDQFVFAGDFYNPTTYRYSDSGTSWQPVLDISYPIGASQTGVFATLGRGELVRSTDDGNNWIHADTGLAGVAFESFLAIGTNIFLGTDRGVFYSTNDGTSWANVSANLPSGQAWAVTANDKYLFTVIYGAGVWRRPLSDFNNSGVTSSVDQNSISLESYPDPIAFRTTISFALPEAGAAILTITDAAGRETSLLRSAWLAAGPHEVTWDASGFPSGVYLCRLVASGGSAARRMVVMH